MSTDRTHDAPRDAGGAADAGDGSLWRDTPDEDALVYPPQLAVELLEVWGADRSAPQLPGQEALARMLDTLYQVSFLQEEGLPVRCRVVLAEPDDWTLDEGPPGGFHVLPFSEERPFTAQEFRKLAPAASYDRTLIGIRHGPSRPGSASGGAGSTSIWGVIASGNRWVNRMHGGRYHGASLPPHLVVHVLGPGRLLVARGYDRLLELAGGRLQSGGLDPFLSSWLPRLFRPVRDRWLHQAAEVLVRRSGSGADDAARAAGVVLDESLPRLLVQNVVRRVVSIVQRRGHGGMLIHLPDDRTLASEDVVRMLRMRCEFDDMPSSRRFGDLVLRALARMAHLGGLHGRHAMTWADYQEFDDPELAEIDESLLEMANFLADLMNVDGALVVRKNYDILGFGAEVLGEFSVVRVRRALDLEGTTTIAERADSSGTRHRAAYRLAMQIPDSLVLVVSQDGATRFVANRDGEVVYWPYQP
jgi:hypothetical protein